VPGVETTLTLALSTISGGWQIIASASIKHNRRYTRSTLYGIQVQSRRWWKMNQHTLTRREDTKGSLGKWDKAHFSKVSFLGDHSANDCFLVKCLSGRPGLVRRQTEYLLSLRQFSTFTWVNLTHILSSLQSYCSFSSQQNYMRNQLLTSRMCIDLTTILNRRISTELTFTLRLKWPCCISLTFHYNPRGVLVDLVSS
jgi:hypothetical protein